MLHRRAIKGRRHRLAVAKAGGAGSGTDRQAALAGGTGWQWQGHWQAGTVVGSHGLAGHGLGAGISLGLARAAPQVQAVLQLHRLPAPRARARVAHHPQAVRRQLLVLLRVRPHQ